MEDHHAATAPYQQRIWTVSHALDQLALTCEQHHLQTKHVDGLPDWGVHKAAAGIASPVRRDVPPNFAWHDYEKAGSANVSGRMDREELGGEDRGEHERGNEDERVTQELRASTSDLLSRLTPPSLHSSVSSTAAVFPLSAEERSLQKNMKPQESHSHDHSSNGSYQSMSRHHQTSSTSNGSVREAGEPYRRRKVHFADHGRSSRADRQTKRMFDLTYQEALGSVTPSAAHYAPGMRSAYQETYQWPTREAYVTIMDQVGGQTAGGEARYEPRRVFTADEAMCVAEESARDLLKKTKGKPVEQQDQALPNLDEEKTQDGGEENTRSPAPGTTAADQIVATSSSHRLARAATSRANLKRPAESVSELAIASSCVEASTQTEASQLVKTRTAHKLQQPLEPTPSTRSSHSSGTRLGIARSERVTETKKRPLSNTNQQEMQRRVRKPVLKDAVPQAARGNPRQQRYNQPNQQRSNPIFLNARYPLEPLVFRGKSTYATVYGSKPSWFG